MSAVADEHGPEASAAGCALALDLERGVVGVWDRLRLEQVVKNLLLDAIKFGRNRSVELTVGRTPDGALLQVADHGVGVAEADRARIFQRFERVQSAANVDGLGLGLFIVRAIVEAHDGRVGVGQRAGGGAVFRVSLPVASPLRVHMGADDDVDSTLRRPTGGVCD